MSWEGNVRWAVGLAEILYSAGVLEAAGAGSLRVSRRHGLHQKTKPIFR